MKQYLPKEQEIMEFFKTHSGSLNSIRIAEVLIQRKVNHTTPHDAEWQHVRGLLFSLKSRGFVELKNEGAQVIEECFYSTPDRIEKYYNPDMNKILYDRKDSSTAFINNGVMAISSNTKSGNLQNKENLQSIVNGVIGGLILIAIVYLVYVFTGINLSL